jgi:hypothetical protein
MTDPAFVVFDEAATVAVGQGNREASKLIERARTDPTRHLYAPTCAPVEADRIRPGTAEHIASLSAFDIVDLGLSAALHLARDATWAHAHTRHTAKPDAERPAGTYVATMNPDCWSDEPVDVIDLRSA